MEDILFSIPPGLGHWGSTYGEWDLNVVSTVGPDHAQSGAVSDDACAVAIADGTVIAVVSDGAGSAKFGARGAATAATEIARFLRTRISDGLAPWDLGQRYGTEWRKTVEAGIEQARHQLAVGDGIEKVDVAPENLDQILATYHATIAGAVLNPDSGLFFHIGDGLCAAMSLTSSEAVENAVPLDALCLSLPQNGEYLDQTFFFTEPMWRSNLRLSWFSQYSMVMLMTDGVSPFVLMRDKRLEDQFVLPIARYLKTVSCEAGAKMLFKSLSSTEAAKVSGDDKTLICIMRRARGSTADPV